MRPRPGGAGASITKLSLCWALVLGLLVLGAFSASAARAASPIQAENALPGDSHWKDALGDPVSAITGYASATSVRPGSTITFQVSTNPVAHYRIEISRLGWYGGAGGRRVACLVGATTDPTCTLDHLGITQPAPPPPDSATGEVNAGWSPTDTLTVPDGWTSGYYVAVLRLTSGPSAGKTGFVPFVVQAPAGDRAAILVQVPSNTWQAYNAWGGEGFYSNPRAVKVSFNRPYDQRLLFNWEYPLVRFLERGGWDVSYATDDNVDAEPSILLNHTLDMSAGHDEYWTKAMRDGWEAARAAGVNLAFMGADDGYWQVRYEGGGRTMVGYKFSADPEPNPALKTTQFRWLTPARPECQLMGVEFQNVVLSRRNVDAVADPAVAQDPWFAGTGISPGAILSGLGGYETDAVTAGCHVPPVTPLLSYSGAPVSNGTPVRGDAARYTACSGAEVFSTGSLQFSWGLDSWRDPSYSAPGFPPVPPAVPGLQVAMTNALSDLTRSHVPAPGPPQICVPTAVIATPGTWVGVGQPVTFRAQVTDQYGELASERWSVTLAGQTAAASGPRVSRTFYRTGVVQVSLAAADSSGASATAVRTLRVCPCPAPGSAPPGAENGAPCELSGLGTLVALGGRLWFAPRPGIATYSLSAYRFAVRRGRSTLTRVALNSAARASQLTAVPAVRASMLIDVAVRGRSRVWHQQFLVPAAAGHAGRAGAPTSGVLAQAMCDGTSGRVLSPEFRGRTSAPLRIAVSGPGRVTVTVARLGGRVVYRRVIVARRRTVVVSVASRRLARGVYRVTVAAVHSRLPAPVRLIALAL